jgi:UDP-N-acetylglucosamine 2-epimerase
LKSIDTVLLKEMPDLVLVRGIQQPSLMVSWSGLSELSGYVEAGLRTYNKRLLSRRGATDAS